MGDYKGCAVVRARGGGWLGMGWGKDGRSVFVEAVNGCSDPLPRESLPARPPASAAKSRWQLCGHQRREGEDEANAAKFSSTSIR